MKDNSELFPHRNYPIRLEVKNTNNSIVCYFECVDHMTKYIERTKPKNSDIQVDYNTKVFSKEEIDKMPTYNATAPKKRTRKTTATKKTKTKTKTKPTVND